MSRLLIALELVAFVAIIVADANGFVPLTQTILLLPFIWLALRLQKQPWATIGFAPPPDERQQMLASDVRRVVDSLLLAIIEKEREIAPVSLHRVLCETLLGAQVDHVTVNLRLEACHQSNSAK